MYIETTNDLAEKIADWMGVYGCCNNQNCGYNEDKPVCCRDALIDDLKVRMVTAVENEKRLEEMFGPDYTSVLQNAEFVSATPEKAREYLVSQGLNPDAIQAQGIEKIRQNATGIKIGNTLFIVEYGDDGEQ